MLSPALRIRRDAEWVRVGRGREYVGGHAPFFHDGAHQFGFDQTHGSTYGMFIERDIALFGQQVLERPDEFYITPLDPIGQEAPYYCAVRLNKHGNAAYYCYGRGFTFDVLYLSWKTIHTSKKTSDTSKQP